MERKRWRLAPDRRGWDRDGKLDLLVGTGNGGVIVFRNIGDAKAPKLSPAQRLVPDRKHNYQPLNEVQPGFRSKICVTDFLRRSQPVAP